MLQPSLQPCSLWLRSCYFRPSERNFHIAESLILEQLLSALSYIWICSCSQTQTYRVKICQQTACKTRHLLSHRRRIDEKISNTESWPGITFLYLFLPSSCPFFQHFLISVVFQARKLKSLEPGRQKKDLQAIFFSEDVTHINYHL